METARLARLFVIDDQISLLESLKMCLQENYEVFTFQSGEDCLAALDEIQPDIVLTDFEMHGMNGLELAKAIKQKYPEVPIVLLTSAALPGLLKPAKDAGVRLCMNKPFDLYELKYILRKLSERA